MTEESREPAAVAGAQAGQGGPAPAGSDPSAAEPAALVPGARKPETAEKPETADDEHAELERLRAEVRELRAQGPGPDGEQGDGQGAQARRTARSAGDRWRAVVAAVAIVLGCVLAPVSVLGVWAANQVSNTDRYVANVAPLIDQPPIQQALSAKITSEIDSRLDVKALTASASAELAQAHLPRLSALLNNFSVPIANGIDGLISSTVARAVASPAMATLWVTANRAAHAGLVKVLSGQGNGTFAVVNGKVVLQIGPLINQVKQNLVARGLTIADKIPQVNATFPLFAAPNLAKAQTGYRLITTLRWVLPLLTIALLAAGVWLARGHRRALLRAALGFSGSMLVLAIALAIARGIYLNSVPQSVLPSDAAAAAYDTLVRFIKEGLRVLLVVGLVVAAGAFLVGPSTAAVRTRRAVASGIGWVRARGERAGLNTGPVGDWTRAHKTMLRVAVIGVAALIFVFWGQPSVALVIWLVVLLLVALGVIELLGGKAPQPAVPQE